MPAAVPRHKTPHTRFRNTVFRARETVLRGRNKVSRPADTVFRLPCDVLRPAKTVLWPAETVFGPAKTALRSPSAMRRAPVHSAAREDLAARGNWIVFEGRLELLRLPERLLRRLPRSFEKGTSQASCVTGRPASATLRFAGGGRKPVRTKVSK